MLRSGGGVPGLDDRVGQGGGGDEVGDRRVHGDAGAGEATSGVRRAGAATLDLCDLACGRLDGFWEHWLMPWDVAAGVLIVREGGGTFGPLPSCGDPALDEAIQGGEAIARAFAGTGELARGAGGGFLAGNRRLDPTLHDFWSEAMLDL
ncbi:inositol monophosphatase family protein [Candidatus Palauibacter sp.]|uniref:inositol monophosphatase family protein n=1 Tax=Candidatus Palauibacter sp. TaxID=3101350 RepID=UPI003AF25A67